MKKELYLKSLLLLIILLTGGLTASAYDFTVDNIHYTYNTDGNTVSVSGASTSYNYGDVIIPETITYNGVTFSVTAIGDRAFSQNSYLKSIEIPNSITSIGDYAFIRCTGLTSIDIPNSVTSIGNSVFSYCSGLFSATLPQSVKIINDWLFSDCTNLTYVSFGDSVSYIGGCAFDFCSKLRSISIPSTVTTIGNSAFRGCSSLSSIVIPKSTTEMGLSVLARCTNLTSIQVEDGNPRYDSRDNCNAVIETSSNTLIAGCQTTSIPNTVITIGELAFEGYGNKSIKIPTSIITIGASAFSRSENLESIVIPNSVTQVGSMAFYGCNRLTKVTIGSSVVNLDFAFPYLTSITSITCLAMSPPQCSGYSGFENSVYSNAILQVPAEAINDYRTTSPWSSFKNIQSLDLNRFEVDGIYYHALGASTVSVTYKDTNYNTYSGEVVIPKTISYDKTYNVVGIDGFAFRDSRTLTAITIPESITLIGENAFYGCNNLASISVESGNAVYDSRGNCNALIETASNSLIAGCNNTIIPNTVSAIGEFAFFGRTGLVDINIPNSVRTIDDQAFAGCSKLTNVTIGNSVTSIGFLAFCGCDKLVTITCYAPVPPVMEYELNCFDSSTLSTAILRVPNEYLDAYVADRFWSEFLHIVPFIGAGPGDVNGDGSLKISDVTSLVDLLLTGDELPAYADVNGDANVSIADVTVLVDILLNGN